MAYADQKAGPSKIIAIGIVALIHIALGYAFITGLAYKYVKQVTKDLNAFDVEEPPPPPPDEPPPPPPPDQPLQPPPVVSPPPLVRVPTPAPIIQTVPIPPPAAPVVPIAVTPVQPAPPARPVVSQAAQLRGNVGQFFGPDNYPDRARDAEAQGSVRATLTVGADGRVSDCRVTSSSGNRDLDDATCRISKQRVRFTPAKDAAGNPIGSTYPLAIRWQLN